MNEARSGAFRESLVALLRDVTGERVVASGTTEVYVSEAAMDALGVNDA